MSGWISYLVFFSTVVGIYAVAVLGLNLQWGYTGLFNAGVVGFLAVGGYAFAILTGPPRAASGIGLGLPFIVGIAGAMLAAGLAALVIGLATLRLREDYLAIATFGIAVTIQLFTLNAEDITGGTLGLHSIPRPLQSLFETPQSYGVFYLALVAAVLGLVYWGLERIVSAPWGRVLATSFARWVAARSMPSRPPPTWPLGRSPTWQGSSKGAEPDAS